MLVCLRMVRGRSMPVRRVTGVPRVARMSGVSVACVPRVLTAVGVAAVRESADGHNAKSHGACRQRDKIEIHDSRDTVRPRRR